MGSFIFTKFRQTPATGARVNFLLSANTLILPNFLLAGLAGCVLWHPSVFLSHALFSAVYCRKRPGGVLRMAAQTVSSEALWAILYSMFWIFGLSWITPYALVTVGNSKWLTRDVAPKKRTLRWPRRLMLQFSRRSGFFAPD